MVVTSAFYSSMLNYLSPGDIVHLRAMGRSFVVLGNAEVVLEYLEKRSANTSDRIDSPLTEV